MNAYHHGNLRPALLEAAVGLAREHGMAGLVLREVARRTGVSHNAAYRHFADRDELVAEVSAVAMGRLEDAMRHRIATVSVRDPARRAVRALGAAGRAYVDFALGEPGLFEVAFAGVEPRAATGAAGVDSGAYALLAEILDELVRAGLVSSRRRRGAEVACWAAVHGFATLSVRGPLRGLPADDRAAALDVVLDTVRRGLTSDPPR